MSRLPNQPQKLKFTWKIKFPFSSDSVKVFWKSKQAKNEEISCFHATFKICLMLECYILHYTCILIYKVYVATTIIAVTIVLSHFFTEKIKLSIVFTQVRNRLRSVSINWIDSQNLHQPHEKIFNLLTLINILCPLLNSHHISFFKYIANIFEPN